MDFDPRSMLTAGIRRETSPARCPAPCGAAKASAGIASRSESETARPRAQGDFVFISRTLLNEIPVSIVVTGECPDCQSYLRDALPTLYMPVQAHAAISLSRRRETMRPPDRRAVRCPVKVLRRL